MADNRTSSSFTGSPLLAAMIAVVILLIVGIAMFFLNPTKVAEIAVSKVDIFAPHTQFDSMGGSVHVLGQAPSGEDDLYVIAHIRFTDKLRLGEILSTWTGLVKLADGRTIDAATVPPSQLSRLEEIFPDLAPLITQPFHYGDEAMPGATREGSIVLMFPNMTQAQWQSRQTASLTINLRDQPPQTVILH